MTDPFATPAPVAAAAPAADPFGEQTDPFDTPRQTLPNLDWLVGRLCLIYPSKKLTGLKSKSGGADYEAVVADVYVLDGAITEFVPAVPGKIEDFRFNGENFVPELERSIGTGRPKLFRIAEQPSRPNPKVMTRFPDRDVTEGDKVLAKAFMANNGLL